MITSVPVVVLKLTSLPFHHGSLGIVRTLGRLGVPVYTFQDSRWVPGAFSRYAEGRFTRDLGGMQAEEAVEYLLEVGARLGGAAILIPVDDVGSIFVADHADALKERFCFPNQPAGLARRLASKKELYALCMEMKIPTPATTFPRSRRDVLSFIESATFPVVMKASDPLLIREKATAKSVSIAQNADQLLSEYDGLEQDASPNLILQEYIPGDVETIWMFNGYFNEDSECLIGLTGKKIRQFPAYTGATSLGVCVKNEQVAEVTRSFMKAVGYRGILDIGYRFDARDGQYKVLDVNPRVGATFRLFGDTSGLDVVRAMYLDLTGQELHPGLPREGRKWIAENCDVLSGLEYRRAGKLTLQGWLRSLPGTQEAAWFSTDDPLPFAVMCATFFPRVALDRFKARKASAKVSSS
jgi:predicted ATP-grasp superfamily ATP-dependent carboligase